MRLVSQQLASGCLAGFSALSVGAFVEAAPITVPNNSFETPTLPADQFGGAEVANWTVDRDAGSNSETGGANAGLPSGADQHQAVRVHQSFFVNFDGFGKDIVTSGYLGGGADGPTQADHATVAVGAVYTLTVSVAALSNGSANGIATIQLLGDGNVLKEQSFTQLTAFTDESIQYTGTQAASGATLAIRLLNSATFSGDGGTDVYFDDVRLDGPDVPEPASLGFLSVAGSCLLRRRRR